MHRRLATLALSSILAAACSQDAYAPVPPTAVDFGRAPDDASVADAAPDLNASEVVTPSPGEWPLACDLPSVNVPPGTEPIRGACLRLHHAAGVRQRVCPGASAGGGGPEFVDACVALATAPGAQVAAGDLEACARDTCAFLCGDLYNGCLFAWGPSAQLLWPNHDHKGRLPPGSPCVADLQCDSGYCSVACGVCQRSVGLGGSCAPGQGEPPDIALCLAGQCVSGTCAHKGLPDGAPCSWFYGTEGCAHRCLQADWQPPGKCAPLGKAGEWCGGANNSPECEPGLVCVRDKCVPILPDGTPCDPERDRCAHVCMRGTCARVQYGRGLGEDCSYDHCLPELVCQSLRCAPPPVPDLGGADFARSYLPLGAKCGKGQGECAPDQRCWTDCQQPGCFYENAVCKLIPPVGAPCLSGQCVAGAACYQGRCQIPSGEGGPCPCLPQATCSKAGRCIAFGPAMCEP